MRRFYVWARADVERILELPADATDDACALACETEIDQAFMVCTRGWEELKDEPGKAS